MGAGNGHDMAALQHVFCQPLRAAGVRQAQVQDGFHQRIARLAVGQARSRHHVTHHDVVGLAGQARELVGVIAFDQLDA